MTARKTPAKPAAPKTDAVNLSGEMIEVPSEALANEVAAAESIAQDVEAPADEIAEAIAELEAELNKKAAPAKKAAPKKEPVTMSHANCTTRSREQKARRHAPPAAVNVPPKPQSRPRSDPLRNDRPRRLRADVSRLPLIP